MKKTKLFLLFFLIASTAKGKATIPVSDVPGSQDHPLLRRYEGSYIISYEHQGFTEYTLPLSRLEPVSGKRDRNNNQYFEPKQKKQLEGPYTRLVYLLPADRSPLEVIRNYQQEIQGKGGRILFECRGEECGGDATLSSNGGGGDMSLSMYLFPYERLKDEYFSTAGCAITNHISDQRYLSAEVASSSAHVSVLAYSLLTRDSDCDVLKGRTVAIVEIVESKAREQKMVTVSADEMARQIADSGSVSLYGIYFDFNSAEVKPQSAPTLEEIARLLKNNAGLHLLVVGHTDNVGGFEPNMSLSRRRAESVVAELASKYKIDRARLLAVGVSFASPVASNKTDEGRARNRRVQLVEN